MSTTIATEAQSDKGSRKAVASDRSTAENKLGLKLVAPAVVLMLLVTAWPMIQALYLSLFRYRLTAPDDREFHRRRHFNPYRATHDKPAGPKKANEKHHPPT